MENGVQNLPGRMNSSSDLAHCLKTAEVRVNNFIHVYIVLKVQTKDPIFNI